MQDAHFSSTCNGCLQYMILVEGDKGDCSRVITEGGTVNNTDYYMAGWFRWKWSNLIGSVSDWNPAVLISLLEQFFPAYIINILLTEFVRPGQGNILVFLHFYQNTKELNQYPPLWTSCSVNNLYVSTTRQTVLTWQRKNLSAMQSNQC
jgi:hypothetical protein